MSAREEMWRDLAERGFHCIYDSEYGPHMNADALCLFNLYPRLMQKHGSGIWCTAPGRALIVAFGIVSDEWNDPLAIATRIAESWSDIAVIALADAVGIDAASRAIAERVIADIRGATVCQPNT